MAELNGPSNLERKLHTCQVLLWLKQTYRVQDGGTEDLVLSKEAVYQTYMMMVSSQHPNCGDRFAFSRPVLGKMVKRAFPAVPSIRRGPRGRVKQLYVGLIPRLTQTQGPRATSQIAQQEEDEGELMSEPTGHTDEEDDLEGSATSSRKASFSTTTTPSPSCSSSLATSIDLGSTLTTTTSTTTSSSSAYSSPCTGADTSPLCHEQRRDSESTQSTAPAPRPAATPSRCHDDATASTASEADYRFELLMGALMAREETNNNTNDDYHHTNHRPPAGRRLSAVEWAEAIIPSGAPRHPRPT